MVISSNFNVIFITKTWHVDSPWNRDQGELGNSHFGFRNSAVLTVIKDNVIFLPPLLPAGSPAPTKQSKQVSIIDHVDRATVTSDNLLVYFYRNRRWKMPWTELQRILIRNLTDWNWIQWKTTLVSTQNFSCPFLVLSKNIHQRLHIPAKCHCIGELIHHNNLFCYIIANTISPVNFK